MNSCLRLPLSALVAAMSLAYAMNVIIKTPLFAPSLFFHLTLENEVRIQGTRQACMWVGRKDGGKEDRPFSKTECGCHM